MSAPEPRLHEVNTSPLPDTAPVIGSLLPQRHHRLLAPLARGLLRAMGWRIVGDPPNAPRFMLASVPHTSNLDGFILVLALLASGLQLHWMAKASIFKGWRGRVFRRLGGVPVDRGNPRAVIRQVADAFAAHDHFVLAVAPEGTRARTSKWKSGFYRMAQAAEVPICMGFMDYPSRRVGFGPHFLPCGDYPADLQRMRDFYQHVTPRYPEQFALPATLDDRQPD